MNTVCGGRNLLYYSALCVYAVTAHRSTIILL